LKGRLGFSLAQNRFRSGVNPVSHTPLNIADPDTRARQFGRKSVDFDAMHDFGTDQIAGAAGRVENGDAP
jgi:hypothetical protein